MLTRILADNFKSLLNFEFRPGKLSLILSLPLRHLAFATVGLVLTLPAQLSWAAGSGGAEKEPRAAEVSRDRSSHTPSAAETGTPEAEQPAVQSKEGAAAGAGNQPEPKSERCPAIKPEPQKIPRYIGDWEQLSRLAGSDRVIAPMADQLASTNRFAIGVAKVGVLSGLGLGFLGVISGASGDSWSKQDKGLAIAGAGIAVLSLVTYWFTSPDRSDFVDVINLWNQRHPDLPIAP